MPKEMRKCYGMELNDNVELIPTEDGVLIIKCEKKEKDRFLVKGLTQSELAAEHVDSGEYNKNKVYRKEQSNRNLLCVENKCKTFPEYRG